MKIVVASNNEGKIQELHALLADIGLVPVPQAVFKVKPIEETALTFVENALLKARHACRETGLSAIADDSGLVVPALQGAPGIHSARYAGTEASTEDNIKKLLTALIAVPEANRAAYFHCSLVFMRHEKDPAPLICQGEWTGSILFSP
ncbi:MAG TPA: non-canonical purine NTP pyrophosphatase, partial [Gammaproteobacteria bacterium]|nr:non-canonical purine NTP pyrophosphatase [Gammaproteobacteria bacterium]